MPVAASLRGLTVLRPVPVQVEVEAEVRRRSHREASRPKARRSLAAATASLIAFRAAPPNLDLRALFVDVFGAQLGGWFDPRRERLVLVRRPDAFAQAALTEEDAGVVVHELVHALQHQHHDLQLLLDRDLPSSDVELAVLAAVEGDASYAMARLAAGERAAELDALDPTTFRDTFLPEADPTVVDPAVPSDRLPLPLRRGIAFPYVEGMAFAQAQVAWGGLPALDAALRAPPLSSEQVLHPERYRAGDVPRWPDLPSVRSLLGPGWRVLDDDAVGELGVLTILQTWIGNAPGIPLVAEGWGGDRYLVVQRGRAPAALLWWTAWDTAADATQFHDAIVSALPRAQPGLLRAEAGWTLDGRAWRVHPSSDKVLVVIDLPPERAPDVLDALTRAPERPFRTLDEAAPPRRARGPR